MQERASGWTSTHCEEGSMVPLWELSCLCKLWCNYMYLEEEKWRFWGWRKGFHWSFCQLLLAGPNATHVRTFYFQFCKNLPIYCSFWYLSPSVWLCWKDMKMRSNVWRGHPQGTSWPHVAETRVFGFGKVRKFSSLSPSYLSCSKISKSSVYLSSSGLMHTDDLLPFVFHSGRGGRVWVCYCGKLSHTGCQTCCVAPYTGGGLLLPVAQCTGCFCFAFYVLELKGTSHFNEIRTIRAMIC